MTQTIEHLELSTEAYHTLEQIAQKQGVTLSRAIENLLQPFQTKERLDDLRQEYHRLVTKDLARTLTPEDEERIDVVCQQLNAYERQFYPQREQRAKEIDARLERLEHLIQSLPDRAEETIP